MAKMSKRTIGALWLLIAPTVLIIFTFLAFTIINWIFNPTMWPRPDTELFAPTPIGITISNIILFFTGVIGIISWLPGLIIGTVLLATAKK
jgi:hypothetical protein